MIKYFLVLLIDIYRCCISPYIPRSCRFYPTCSCYAKESINAFGAFRGGCLAVKRLLKCHPYHAGGVDLVPPVKNQDI